MNTSCPSRNLLLFCLLLLYSSLPVAAQPSRHVVMVVEENQQYDDIIGSPAMPYLNGLAERYSLAVNYFGVSHPSIGNYFMLVTGNIVTEYSDFDEVVDRDNLVRQLTAQGKTWKVYAESLPHAGYLGFNHGNYLKRHNPFAFLSDVVHNPQQAANIVPYSQFAADVAADRLPDFAFLVPDRTSDMHDCPDGGEDCSRNEKARAADRWLRSALSPLEAKPEFSRDCLVIVTFDESRMRDREHGGGHIALVLAGAVRRGYQSGRFYQHASTLRLICDFLRLDRCPGRGASAPSMAEFLNAP